MGEIIITKSEQKKQLILKRAKKVFMEKGFQSVTMTDIVEACEISRGGLYKYYKSTHEIFLKVLYMSQQETGAEFSHAIKNGSSAVKILESFLQEQKDDLLNQSQNLTVATYEFFFLNKDLLQENILKQQFDSGVRILSNLIQYGIDRGEFRALDKNTIAKNIILLLEGIRVSSNVMAITEELIDDQFDWIRDLLMMK